MNWIKNRDYYSILAGVILSCAIYFKLHLGKIRDENCRYTIGIICKIDSGESRCASVCISFLYKGREYKCDYIDNSSQIKSELIGKRLFIKFVPNDPSKTYDIKCSCLVPNC